MESVAHVRKGSELKVFLLKTQVVQISDADEGICRSDGSDSGR